MEGTGCKKEISAEWAKAGWVDKGGVRNRDIRIESCDVAKQLIVS